MTMNTCDFVCEMMSHAKLLFYNVCSLTLLHSEQPKLHKVLAVLSAIGLSI